MAAGRPKEETMTRQNLKPDGIGNLADSMVEDILAASMDELDAEVTEDHGNAQALSAEFDRLIAPILQKSTADEAVVPTTAWRAVNEEGALSGVQEWFASRWAWFKSALQA